MYVLDMRWVTDSMRLGYYASNAARTDGHARTTASAVSEITEHGVDMEKPMNIENDDIIVTSGSGYILIEGEKDMCMSGFVHSHKKP